MSNTEVSKSNFLFTFLGSLGALLIFILIVFVAYLPNRPAPVDATIIEQRQQTADEARATSNSKLQGYAVVDAQSGTVRIPIEEAMKMTVDTFQATE